MDKIAHLRPRRREIFAEIGNFRFVIIPTNGPPTKEYLKVAPGRYPGKLDIVEFVSTNPGEYFVTETTHRGSFYDARIQARRDALLFSLPMNISHTNSPAYQNR